MQTQHDIISLPKMTPLRPLLRRRPDARLPSASALMDFPAGMALVLLFLVGGCSGPRDPVGDAGQDRGNTDIFSKDIKRFDKTIPDRARADRKVLDKGKADIGKVDLKKMDAWKADAKKPPDLAQKDSFKPVDAKAKDLIKPDTYPKKDGLSSTCGDLIKNGSDACDGQDLGGKTCVTEGFAGGTLACTSLCKLDTTQCSMTCGNGVLDKSESCDGSLMGSATCATYGYSSGKLGCTSACTYETGTCFKEGWLYLSETYDSADRVSIGANGGVYYLAYGLKLLGDYIGSSSKYGLARLDTQGDVKSLVSLNVSTATITDFAVDSAGNLFITGYFKDQAQVGTTVLLAKGGSTDTDAFLARLDATGKPVWVAQIGGSTPQKGGERGLAIRLDGSANVYVSGVFANNTTIGTKTLTVAGPATSDTDIFVSKWTSGGSLSWVITASGSEGDGVGSDLAVDSTGNLYMAWTCVGHTKLASTSITLDAPWLSAGCLAKVSSTGTVSYTRTVKSADVTTALRVALDGIGGVYLAGSTQTKATFGGYHLPNHGKAYVAKLNASGTFQWASALGERGSGALTLRGLAADSTGVTVAGQMDGTWSSFGSIKVHYPLSTLDQEGDIFVARLDSTGKVKRVAWAGGTSEPDLVHALASDSQGMAYVAGTYSENSGTYEYKRISFGDKSVYYGNAYLWKLDLK